MFRPIFLPTAIAVVIAAPLGAQSDDAPIQPADLMTFAQGVLPVAIDTGDAELKVDMKAAVALIDGNPGKLVVTAKPGTENDLVAITYALPAATRFDRFAVPAAPETPSPSQTLFRDVEVLGSDQGPEGPFVMLAAGTLGGESDAGEATDLTLGAERPEVRWIQLQLGGGVSVERDKTYFEFTEIIGNGVQTAPPLSDGFNGVWDGRGVDMELAQDGAAVTGCYDGESRLSGTVEGKVLRALGANPAGIPSQFILIAMPDGELRGLRSSNGAPFKPYDGAISDAAPTCLPTEAPALGCGSVVHGIGFDFDSDVIRSEAQEIIAALHAGLAASGATAIEIVGHSSSEGSAEYNRDLSQRRAASVSAALAALGLDGATLSAAGRGEDEPIASNQDEAGRSLNRRVEVVCAG